MMAEPAVAEEPRQHGQGARRESLIDERLLSFERLDRGTTGQGVFAGIRIGNLRVKLTDCSQAFGLMPVPAVEWLAQNELPARRVVAKIEPVCDVARFSANASVN